MKKAAFAFAVLYVSSLFGQEAKSFLDGNKLLDRMQLPHTRDNVFMIGEADGYVNGVTDLLTNDREKRHIVGAALVRDAMVQAFPCPAH